MHSRPPPNDSGVAHPLHTLLVVLLVVFATEGAIMLVLPAIAPWPPGSLGGSLTDSSLLVVITAPALWLLIVRPLRNLSRSRGALLRRVYDAQEREQARLGRDLHDEVGQQFTALLVGLRCIEQSATADDARRLAGHLHAAAADGLEEVRRLSRGLRPTVLEEFGLIAAVERLCEDARAAHALDVRLDVSLGSGDRFDPSVELTAYRVVQEALTNAARHALARHVDVGVRTEARELAIKVSDDGRGFDVQHEARATASLGIQSMRERARMLGGTLAVESTPGQGTRVCLTLPVTE